MTIIERMDFNKAKNAISSVYLPYIEYLESLEVGKLLVDEQPLDFKYGNLVQHWKLQIGDRNSDFSIICNKNDKEMKIECLTANNNIPEELRIDQNLFDYLETNYEIKVNKYNSVTQIDPKSPYDFFYLEFEEVLTVEQLANLYRDIFVERR